MKKTLILLLLFLCIGLIFFIAIPFPLHFRENLNFQQITSALLTLTNVNNRGERVDSRWELEGEAANQVVQTVFAELKPCLVIKRFRNYTHHALYTLTFDTLPGKTYSVSFSDDLISISDLDKSHHYTLINPDSLPTSLTTSLSEILSHVSSHQ